MAEVGGTPGFDKGRIAGSRPLEEALLGHKEALLGQPKRLCKLHLGTRIPWPSVKPAEKIPSVLRRASSSLSSCSSEASLMSSSHTLPPVRQWFTSHWQHCSKRESKFKSKGVAPSLAAVVRESFYDRRAQLLTGDRHNLDILTPYATLHLHITEAANLLALDANGLSDPYVEVFVNDVSKGRSRYMPRSLDPKWDYSMTLDIWSPFSIVRIAVMDHDRFSKDELMGFVELRVAEVEPNGSWISGWCELRLAGMLEGTATHRFRHHKSFRDDHETPRNGEPTSPGGSPRKSAELDEWWLDNTPVHGWWLDKNTSITSGYSSEAPVLGQSRSLRTRSKVYRQPPVVKRTAASKLAKNHLRSFGEFINAGKRAKGLLRVMARDLNATRRVNAGEVHVAMRLETLARRDGRDAPHDLHPSPPELGWILLSALFYPSWLLDKCSEEWYACCFPHPEFETAGGHDDEDPFSLQDVKEFYETASQVKSALLNCIGWPIVSIFLYLVSWRDMLLSSITMAYWSLFCLWPRQLLPTLPLCAAFCLLLLRDRGRCNSLLAHEATAPLTEEGLAMMAALRSSKRMSVWLKRLVKDRGGWVKKMTSLREYARLMHKDGAPTLSFELVVHDLMAQSWVNRKVSREKHCREGHVLHFIGMGAYLPDDGWVCSGPAGPKCHCLDCQAGIHHHGLHLGVKRYHCPQCCQDFCGLCAVGGRAPAMVMRVDTQKLPMGGSAMVRTVRDFVLENQDILDDVQELLEGFLKIVERLRNPKETTLARQVYLGLAASSLAVLLVLVVGGTRIGYLLTLAWTLLCIAAGSTVMVQGAMPIRRARTAYRASRDFEKCLEMRQRGGCARWKFFVVDAESPPETPEN